MLAQSVSDDNAEVDALELDGNTAGVPSAVSETADGHSEDTAHAANSPTTVTVQTVAQAVAQVVNALTDPIAGGSIAAGSGSYY